MFSQWLRDRWPTIDTAEPGAPFKVGRSIFDDDSTHGAWLRILTGQGGQPLPGTECISVALMDAPGPPRALSLESAAEGAPAVETAGAHKIFSLATLASSAVVLSVSTPVLNQLGPLSAMLRDAQRALLDVPASGLAGEAPNLMILERDVLRPAASTAVLEYAMLEPRGDALDGARSAVRRLFHNRTLVQMAPPEASDLEALARGEMPGQYRLRNMPQSGVRPFYAGFEAAASAAVDTLRPKSLGGLPLAGRELAEALAGMAEGLNEHAPVSLAAEVYDSLRSQAKDATEAAVRAGLMALRRLLPAADALDFGDSESERSRGGDEGTGGAAAVRVPAVALLSASSLDLALRNATQSALAEFARRAPRYGSTSDGKPASWLEPYLRSVISELSALGRQARQAHQHAHSLYALARRERQLLRRMRDAEEAVESRVERRVEQALADRLAEPRHAYKHAAGWPHGRAGFGLDDVGPADVPHLARDRQLRQDLLSNLLLLALGASAAACPPAAFVKMAPLVASAPTFFALMGIYRLAQRPVARAASFFWGSVSSVGHAVAGTAAQITERLAARLAETGFGQQLVCGHGLRMTPCAAPS